VDWNKLGDRAEVYHLLDKLSKESRSIPFHVSYFPCMCRMYACSVESMPFSPQVALRLLDSDFPDETVRSFATDMLSSLSDDGLSDYLLQLTQVGDSPMRGFKRGNEGWT
jgi:hypothetical protein